MHEGLVKISALEGDASEQTASFHYLVAADGARHHAVDLFNQRHEKEIKITYQSDPNSQTLHHPYHVSAYVTLSRQYGEPIELPKNRFISTMRGEHVCQLVLDKIGHEKHQGKQVKCNFTGELPAEIFHIQDSEARKAAALHFIHDAINDVFTERGHPQALEIHVVNESKKHGTTKDKLKLSIFERHIQQADLAGVRLGENRFILAGDAYRTPNYQIGSGLNDAMYHAQLVGEVFAGKRNLGDLHDVYVARAQETSSSSNEYSSNKSEAAHRAERFVRDVVTEEKRKHQTSIKDSLTEFRKNKQEDEDQPDPSDEETP